MGPFEAYGTGEMADTPFTEEAGRQDVANFYDNQEDEMFAAAARDDSTWSVHRAHTISGHALGNMMNFALTVAFRPPTAGSSAGRWSSTDLIPSGTG